MDTRSRSNDLVATQISRLAQEACSVSNYLVSPLYQHTVDLAQFRADRRICALSIAGRYWYLGVQLGWDLAYRKFWRQQVKDPFVLRVVPNADDLFAQKSVHYGRTLRASGLIPAFNSIRRWLNSWRHRRLFPALMELNLPHLQQTVHDSDYIGCSQLYYNTILDLSPNATQSIESSRSFADALACLNWWLIVWDPSGNQIVLSLQGSTFHRKATRIVVCLRFRPRLES